MYHRILVLFSQLIKKNVRPILSWLAGCGPRATVADLGAESTQVARSLGLGCSDSEWARPRVAGRESDLHRKHQVETLFPSGTSTRKRIGEDMSRKGRVWHQRPLPA